MVDIIATNNCSAVFTVFKCSRIATVKRAEMDKDMHYISYVQQRHRKLSRSSEKSQALPENVIIFTGYYAIF
jgi:hypothetical protein